MRLDKVFANTTIMLWKQGADKKLTLSFYTEKTVEELCEYLYSKMRLTYTNHTILNVAVMKKGSEGRTMRFNYHSLPIEDIRFRVRKKMLDLKDVMNIKNTRFQMIVKNIVSQHNDSRVITFNSQYDFDDVVKNIKRGVLKKIEEIKSDEIVFHTGKKNLSTHYITITYAGTLERRRKNSKTFTISLPNYSSREIIELMR